MSASISPDASLSLGHLPTRRPLLYSSVASLPDFETNRHQWNEFTSNIFCLQAGKAQTFNQNLMQIIRQSLKIAETFLPGGLLPHHSGYFLLQKFGIPHLIVKKLRSSGQILRCM